MIPFNLIPERSEATPGLWNRPFSALSASIASIEAGSSTYTISASALSATGMAVINANSNVTNYLYFNDTSGQRSDYIIGSQVGGTADGLNIWDASGSTMIASFSKQSIRFYQNVVGPVFDVGGALADTLNAATFGTGADSDESRIQAAISAATTQTIARVYIPANMYPYRSGLVSFATTVQMVREGGRWDVYDAFAYGALGVGHDAAALRAAGNGAAANHGIAYFPPGSYNIGSSLTFDSITDTQFLGGGGNATLLAMAASDITLFQFTGVCSRIIMQGLWLGSFVNRAAGGGLFVQGTVATHADTFKIFDVTVQNVPQPIVFELVDQCIFRTIRAKQTVAGAIKTTILSMRTVISAEMDDFVAQSSAGSFPSDVFRADYDCDTLFLVNSQALSATGVGFRFSNTAGTTGPRLVRCTNLLAESNTSHGFLVEACRDVRMAGCESSLNGGNGYHTSTGSSVAITDSLAYQNMQHGFFAQNASNIIWNGNTASDNGQQTDNTYDGMCVESGVTGAIISNNRSGEVLFSSTLDQRYGLSIFTSTESIIAIGNDLRENDTGGLFNVSTGVHNLVLDQSNVTTSSGGTVTMRSGAIVRNTLLVGGDVANGGEILRTNSHVRFSGYAIVTGANGMWRLDNRASSGSSIMGIYNQDGTAMRFDNLSTNQDWMWLGSTISSSISLVPASSGAADLGSTGKPWGTLSVASGVSVGMGGTLIPAISSISSLIAPFVVQPSASSFTIVTWAAVKAGDQILVTPGTTATVSSISSGLVAHSHCTQNGQIEFRLSNVSTLAQNQSQRTWFFTRITPF